MPSAAFNRRRILAAALAAPAAAFAGAPALAATTPAMDGTASASLANPDAILVAVEQEIEARRAQFANLPGAPDPGDHPEIWDRVWELHELIDTTAAATLVGAAVKLRRLLDPEFGLEANSTDRDLPSLCNVLDVIATRAEGDARLALHTAPF
jgi:hypothetical protein